MTAIAKTKKIIASVIEGVSPAKSRYVLLEDSRKQWSDSVNIKISDKKQNNKWKNTGRGTFITTKKQTLIKSDAKVFAMGSCFAVEIRNALRRKNFEVLPRYFDISFDPERQSVGKLPKLDNINYYNTFTILQEFERAFNQDTSNKDDFWEVTSLSIKSSVGLKTDKLFQDPMRKRIFAGSIEELQDVSNKLGECIREGVTQADAYIITLGMTEVWRNKKSGQYICMAPGRAQMDDVEFVLSDFQTNLENMRALCALIQKNRPGKPVILTVSPVSLERTFTDKDIVIANMESKSILRAVAGQIEQEFENAVYWPSYEIAMREDMYEEDGRHVLKAGVNKIISAFIDTHCQNSLGERHAK